jgi:hypothetical protein
MLCRLTFSLTVPALVAFPLYHTQYPIFHQVIQSGTRTRETLDFIRNTQQPGYSSQGLM